MQPELPLTEATFLILLSMAQAPMHGYAIMQEVALMSDGRIHLSTGTLYGALSRLLEQGWIERLNSAETTSPRVRKEYQLTHDGRRILNAEVVRLQTLLQAALLRLAKGEQ